MRSRRILAITALLAAAACSSSAGPSPSAPPGGTYQNPVYQSDFPDPAVLRVGSTFQAYATQGNGKNIQTLTSPDLVHWKPGPDALPSVGRWASTGSTWAPEVIELGGHYALYYVAHDDRSGKQCVGLAESNAPAGPFTDSSDQPLVCQSDLGGSIDPDPVRGPDGALYLYWKNDGNCCNQPVRLWGERLESDGRHFVGSAIPLLGNTKTWQGRLLEAPEMVAHSGLWTLFYSANDYASDHYAIGYASCRGPLGPCVDAAGPVVSSDPVAAGPGHCFVLQLPHGGWWMLFHAWPPDAIGSTYPGRLLWLEPVSWQGSRPVVSKPDSRPQPLPR